MKLKKLKSVVVLPTIYVVFVIYLFIISIILLPAINDYLFSPRVAEDSYKLGISTQVGEKEVIVFLNFKTKSPTFWAKEAIYVKVELYAPPNNRSINYRVRFPYSTFAERNNNHISYDITPEPRIDLKESNEPFYYDGKAIISYHYRGYFDVIVEERYNKTILDSIILEDVVEIRSHTERDSYNFARIQLAMSLILFSFTIVISLYQISKIRNRFLKVDKGNNNEKTFENNSIINKKYNQEKKCNGEKLNSVKKR